MTARRGQPTAAPPAARRGYALILVLGMVALTLGVCYSMLRLQVTNLQIVGNASRQSGARQAALAGMSIALRRMHEADWAGVDSPIAQQLNAADSFLVTFAAGDDALDAGHPDHPWWPYRVTVTSTGYSADPDNPAIRSEYRVRAVLQLVPRAMSAAPDNWETLNQYTVYQWRDDEAKIQIPVQIEGPALLQGPLSVSPEYPYDEKPFHGAIDEVLIYDYALSGSQISSLYSWSQIPWFDSLGTQQALLGPIHWWRLNEPAGAAQVADSVGGRHGTVVGATTGVSGPSFALFNRAVRFDGQNDHIDLGKFDVGGTGITILAWFRVESFGPGDGRIISKATGIDNGEHYFMLSTVRSGSNHRLRFRLRAGGGTAELIASSGNLPTGGWVFAAATYDGTAMRLYLNGSQVGSQSKSGTIAVNPAVPVFLGDNPPGSSRGQYLRDLARMAAEGDEFRPFTDTVSHPTARSTPGNLSLLQDDLEIDLQNIPAASAAPLEVPGSVGGYRLYPGGALYQAEYLGGSLADRSLLPDPQTNPLGLFAYNGRLTLNSNVHLEGTIVSQGGNGDLQIAGGNVRLQPAWLPPLESSDETVQLPVLLTHRNLQINDGADAEVRGLAVAWNTFTLDSGAAGGRFDFEGRLLTKELQLHGRTDWVKSQSWYRNRLWSFRGQLESAGSGATAYFPRWLEQHENLTAQPRNNFRPPAEHVRFHWQNWNEPIFHPHPNDPGLRWDLLRWQANP